jgi:hypothetical protein
MMYGPKGKLRIPGANSSAPRAGLAGQQFNRLVDFVDKSVRIRHAVISNVAPNLD